MSVEPAGVKGAGEADQRSWRLPRMSCFQKPARSIGFDYIRRCTHDAEALMMTIARTTLALNVFTIELNQSVGPWSCVVQILCLRGSCRR